MPTFPHVRVQGKPRERGRQYGEQARERIGRSIAAYRAVFRHYAGWSWSKVTREARRYEEPIAAYGAAYLEELRGIADGAGVDFDDVLAINTRTEVMFAARARDAARASASALAGCSAFCVLPEASADAHTLIGQNWDWLLHCYDTVVVLEVQREDGPDFVTVVEAGLLAKTGFNSSGRRPASTLRASGSSPTPWCPTPTRGSRRFRTTSRCARSSTARPCRTR
jgi:isopenicillin-N N-acyltransferase-like protein